RVSGDRRKKRRSAVNRGPRLAWNALQSFEAEELFDVRQRCVEPHYVGPEIPAVGGLVPVRAARMKLVVSAIAVVVVHELNIIDGWREHVVGWPGRRRKRRWRRNQAVVVELEGGETACDADDRHVFKAAAGWAASRVPHWVLAGDHQVVGEDQSVHS